MQSLTRLPFVLCSCGSVVPLSPLPVRTGSGRVDRRCRNGGVCGDCGAHIVIGGIHPDRREAQMALESGLW